MMGAIYLPAGSPIPDDEYGTVLVIHRDSMHHFLPEGGGDGPPFVWHLFQSSADEMIDDFLKKRVKLYVIGYEGRG